MEEIFRVGLAGLLILGLMELLWPNMVLAYLNLSLYLFIWLIIGIINVVLIRIDGK